MLSGLMIVVLFLLLPPVPEATWEWPTEGAHRVVRDFRAPTSPWGPGHRELDLAAEGPHLLAPTHATVSFSGEVAGKGVLTLRTPEGLLISFEPVEALVEQGEQVAKGQIIGRVLPGHCPQACIHIGLREKGLYRSPRQELGVLQRSVLLPLEDYALG